jgi:hypothetical protein
VERDRELNHPKTRAQVTAGHRNGVDGLKTQFVRQLPQLGGVKAPEIVRIVDLVQQWGLGRNRHATLLIID